MKPPSRKAHEKTEVERLKDRIAKLEKKQPEALGIQSTIEALRSHAKRLLEERNEMLERMGKLHVVADWFDVLKRNEVMIPTQEGMKYLVGQDLEDFCRAEIKKQDEERHAGYETINLGFSTFAHQALNQIIRDEIDKLALSSTPDTFTYQTKGRYDTRSKSKKESR